MNYSILDNIDYSTKSTLVKMADSGLTFLRIACNGRMVSYNSNHAPVVKKTTDLSLRILAAIGAVIFFPVTLTALAIKWLKKNEWRNVKISEYQFEPIPIPKEYDDFIAFLKNEYNIVKDLDVPLPPPNNSSWRHFGKEELHEKFESFDQYLNFMQGREWPDQKTLCIKVLGEFNDSEKKIFSITLDFLKIFHNISIRYEDNVMTMDELKSKYIEKKEKDLNKIAFQNYIERINNNFPRQNGQYNGELAIDMIQEVIQADLTKNEDKGSHVLAFTNEDLFSDTCKNFVFGIARYHGAGLWSNARFGDPSESSKHFQDCLLRMMKISAHEFGHMRGLPHCTEYECNIGGYFSLKELDERPLLYCNNDTAKICYLTHISFLEYYEKLLQFFLGFNERYNLNYDFSSDIERLNKRIAKLREYSDNVAVNQVD